MTPRVVGLDPSLTRTGLALPDGTVELLRPPKGQDRGMKRLAWIRSTVSDLIHWPPDGGPVDVVAIEGYAHGRPNQAHYLGELGGVLRLSLHDAGVAYVDVPPSVLKRYATGRGNADKQAMQMAATKRLGYDNEKPDDNIVDAMWLRALAMDAYGHPVCSVPKAQRDASVAALTWPRLGRAAA